VRVALLTLALLLAGAPIARAQQWRTRLTLGADAALWIDYAQAAHVLAGGGRELNPVLGSRPSTGGQLAYYGAWIAANTWAPHKVRPLLNALTLLVELIPITHQARYVGLQVIP
jgi:hypothetical protein